MREVEIIRQGKKEVQIEHLFPNITNDKAKENKTKIEEGLYDIFSKYQKPKLPDK